MIEQLFRQHEQYAHMTEYEAFRHLTVPEMLGRLVHYNTPQGPIVFTWTRPTKGRSIETLMRGGADEHLWVDHSPEAEKYSAWIVDVAGGPNVTDNEIGRFLRWVCVEEGIALDGQKVLFHRNDGISKGRIGFFTAREL